MSVISPRNRLVNFRLSEAEFEHLRTACQAIGARSISDFARSSVLEKWANTMQARPIWQQARSSRQRVYIVLENALVAFFALVAWHARRHLWSWGIAFVLAHSVVDYPLQRAGMSGWFWPWAALFSRRLPERSAIRGSVRLSGGLLRLMRRQVALLLRNQLNRRINL